MWEDEERTRDVSNIVKTLIPPVGMRTSYYPGEGGFAERDLTQPTGPGGLVSNAAININAPGGAQSRLAQLESSPTNIPTSGYGQLDLGGRSYSMPPAAIAGAINAGIGGGPSMGAPKYGIPDEMMTRFDDAIKAITGPSETTDLIKMQAQGFGLGMGGRRIPGGGYEPNPRLAASSALAHIEGLKRQAASHLAGTLSALMMDPNKFAQNIYATQTGLASETEKNRLLGRKVAIEETESPYKMRKMAGQAPETVSGMGPGGERVTLGWDPDKQTWTTLTKGAVPVGIHEGERLIDPTTGKVMAEGNTRTRFQENLGQIAFKSFYDELKDVHEKNPLPRPDTKPITAKQMLERRSRAESEVQDKFSKQMQQLGYGDMFKTGGGATGSWDQFKAVNAPKYPNATEDQLRYEYNRIYGGR